MNNYILSEKISKNQGLSLHPEHLEDLRKSGLSDETILKAGVRSVPPAEIKRMLGFEPQKLTSAYLIPYLHTKGFFRLRCFYENGYSGAKYLQKKESGSHIYIPPDLSSDFLKNPEIPLYITEGEKKSLKACQEGLPCIAIAGLWNWSDGSGELIADFNQIEFKNRTVFLLPDNDFTKPNKHGYKKNLELALHRLAMKLIERGAEVYLVELPKSDEKIGLDDFLVSKSLNEFISLPVKRIVQNVEIHQEALRALKRKDLFDVIINELSKEYIKREPELKVTYLACLLPLLGENFAFLVTGESSAGKSSLVSTVLKAFPKHYKLIIFSSSPKALIYRQRELSKMLMWVHEMHGASEIIELLKGLLTEKEAKHFTVGDSYHGKKFHEFEIKAEGFVCFITSTKENFPEEFSNRSLILNLKTTPEIVNAVTALQAYQASGGSAKLCNYELLREIFRCLKSYDVVIPFAGEIQKFIDKNRARIMRDFKKILSLVKAHALLYQFQREIKDGKIIATRDDYEAIHGISNLIVEGISELRAHQVEFLKTCLSWTTRKELVKMLKKSDRTVRDYINGLRDYLEIEGKGSEQKVKAIYIPEPQNGLPPPSLIFQSEESSDGKIGNDWQNGLCQQNLLKNKEKSQIGKLATENYIHNDFWKKADFEGIKILEE